WRLNPDGTYDHELGTSDGDNIQMPLFEAKVDPDIYFLGFKLDAASAKGGAAPPGAPGWFFVIKERPGEPRFGLDDVADAVPPPLATWNDLTWSHLGTQAGHCIDLSQSISLPSPAGDDGQASWGPNTDAANLAYILYQVPVLVAVHAARMLP